MAATGNTVADKSERDYFPFLFSFKNAMKELSKDEKLVIYEAITDYAFFEKTPKLETPMARMAWALIEPVLSKSWVRFRAKKNKTKSNQNQNQIKTKSKSDIGDRIKDKGDRIKDKEREIDIYTSGEAPLSLSLSPEEKEFIDFMGKYFPSVQQLDEPLKPEQYKNLCSRYGENRVMDKLTAMENRKDLLEKNKSAYKTVIKWIQRDEQK